MAVTRQLIFSIDPKTGVSNTFSYADIPDANASSKAIICAHVPSARGGGVSVMQESLFFGCTSAVGYVYQTLKDGTSQDGSTDVTAEFITTRIDPDCRADSQQGRAPTTKRYEYVYFNGPNLTEKDGELYWTKDVHPINDAVVSWTQFNMDDGDTSAYFESGLAEWVHLRGVHSGLGGNEIHLSGFGIDFSTIDSQEGRDS